VEQVDYVAYIARAQDAATIGELHAIAVEVRRTNPGDADAERVVDLCRMYAVDVVARLGRRRGAAAGRRLPRDYTETAYR
jgi:hypothetical protein